MCTPSRGAWSAAAGLTHPRGGGWLPAPQSRGAAGKLSWVAGCFPVDPGRLCVGLRCCAVALLPFRTGRPLQLLGQVQSLEGHRGGSRQSLESCCRVKGKEGDFSWSRAPEAAVTWGFSPPSVLGLAQFLSSKTQRFWRCNIRPLRGSGGSTARLDELLLFVSSLLLMVPSIPAFLQTMLSIVVRQLFSGPFYFCSYSMDALQQAGTSDRAVSVCAVLYRWGLPVPKHLIMGSKTSVISKWQKSPSVFSLFCFCRHTMGILQLDPHASLAFQKKTTQCLSPKTSWKGRSYSEVSGIKA